MRDTAKRFDEAMLAAAATLSLRAWPRRVASRGCSNPSLPDIALPEQVTDFAIANILDALKRIDSELNDYVSGGDTAHLITALDTGLQNLILALRDTIGLWQLGKRPMDSPAAGPAARRS